MKHNELTIIIPSFYPDEHILTKRALEYSNQSLGETFYGKVVYAFNGGSTQGQCRAVNEAASKARTPWIMVANNDMVFSPGWFKEFTSAVERNSLLVASPNLVEPRKGAPPFLEYFCGGLGTEGTQPDFDKEKFLAFAETQKAHKNMSAFPSTEEIEDGFNLPFLIRKDVWDIIGGYDENYDPWSSNSDSDLQYKIMVAGIVPKRVRSTLVYHFSNTSGTFHPDHQAYWQKNQAYFKKKWGVERASSPEIWYKPSLEGITYHPKWEGKYAI